MHCPTCGKSTATDLKFCRSCGMNLEIVGELVAAHPSADKARILKVDAEKAVQMMVVKWLSRGLLMFGIGLVFLFISKSFALGPVARLFSFLAVMFGMGLVIYGVLAGLRANISAQGNAPAATDLPRGKDTKSLPEERLHVPLPSITERTTQLIAQHDDRNAGE